MQDNVVDIKLRGPRRFYPNPEAERVEGPFVLAMQAEMRRIVGEASQKAWIAGFWRGTFGMLPFMGAAFVVGFTMGFVL